MMFSFRVNHILRREITSAASQGFCFTACRVVKMARRPFRDARYLIVHFHTLAHRDRCDCDRQIQVFLS